MAAIYKNTQGNHKGSIVRWPRYEYEKRISNYESAKLSLTEYEEDILLEPMDYQIMVTLNHGLIILSAEQAQRVELIDADLWDESCEEKLQKIYDENK